MHTYTVLLASPHDGPIVRVKTPADAGFVYLLNDGMETIRADLVMRRGRLVMVNAKRDEPNPCFARA